MEKVKQVKIVINTTNSAFDNYTATEVARILRELAAGMESNGMLPFEHMKLFDCNGNSVGTISLTFNWSKLGS